MGSILDRAREDVRNILNNGGFETELTITPTGLGSVQIKGLAIKSSSAFETERIEVIGESMRVTFSEKDLNDLGVVTRQNKILSITGWLVNFTDDIQSLNYTISEPYPDDTLGIIRCKLSLNE